MRMALIALTSGGTAGGLFMVGIIRIVYGG